MPKIGPWTLAIGLTFASALPAAAQAQLFHTWVASTVAGGNDGNNCDRPTPCATYQGAYNNTDAGGEITCVDTGNFGGLTIAHSITVDCEAAHGSSFNTFGISTAATDTVVLRGLDFDAVGATQNNTCDSLGLIYDTGAGVLHLQKMKLNHWTGGCAVSFIPTGPASLTVSDSDITDNGNSGTKAAVYIKPASGVQASVVIDHSRIQNNYFGIIADGTAGGTIRATISNSVVSGNTEDGIAATSSGSAVWLVVDQSEVAGNAYGLAAGGSGAEIVARNTHVFSNNVGLYTHNGGTLYSYGNNSVNGNATNGAFTGTVGLE